MKQIAIMKIRNLMTSFFVSVVPVQNSSAVSNGTASYLIGGIIAMLILGYLIYTLLHPDKF
jgi:K+-transporting ATPase KdpF subunit